MSCTWIFRMLMLLLCRSTPPAQGSSKVDKGSSAQVIDLGEAEDLTSPQSSSRAAAKEPSCPPSQAVRSGAGPTDATLVQDAPVPDPQSSTQGVVDEGGEEAENLFIGTPWEADIGTGATSSHSKKHNNRSAECYM